MSYRMQTSKETVTTIELIGTRYAAMILGVSATTLRKLNIAGKCPKPFKFGTGTKWWHREFMDWIDAGRPSRNEWEERKKEVKACKIRRPAETYPSQSQQPDNAACASIDQGIGRGGNRLTEFGMTERVWQPGKLPVRATHAGDGKDAEEANMKIANDENVVLLNVAQAAAMLGLHRSTVSKLVSSGKFPMPLKFGRASRWSRDELTAWIAAKCPPMAKWEIMKASPVRKIRR